MLKFKLHSGIKVPIVPVPKLPQIVESMALPGSVLNVLKGKGHHGHLSPTDQGERKTANPAEKTAQADVPTQYLRDLALVLCPQPKSFPSRR